MNRGIIVRAIAINGFSTIPEVMDLPAPVPAPDEVLVRLYSAGFNPFDLKVVDGVMKDAMDFAFPMIIGSDGAGIVEAVGEEVTRFRPGQRIFGQFMHSARGLGSYAEYGVVSQAGTVAAMPEGLIFEQAAALPTASMTAYNLVGAAGVDTGTEVLIVGATGGVGQSATQLAAGRSGYVIATAHSDMAATMRDLGADEIVNTETAPIADQVLARHPEGISAIIDLVSPSDAIEPLANLVRPGGTILSTQYALNTDALAARGIHGANFDNRGSGDLLATLAGLVDDSELKILIEAEVPLGSAPALFDGTPRHSHGKTVIEI